MKAEKKFVYLRSLWSNSLTKYNSNKHWQSPTCYPKSSKIKPFQYWNLCFWGFPFWRNPNAVLAILLSACLHFEGKASGVRKAAAKCFPILTFLLLRIECMSFAYHSPNNPKRSSSSNPIVARVARRCWRKNEIPKMNIARASFKSHRECSISSNFTGWEVRWRRWISRSEFFRQGLNPDGRTVKGAVYSKRVVSEQDSSRWYQQLRANWPEFYGCERWVCLKIGYIPKQIAI